VYNASQLFIVEFGIAQFLCYLVPNFISVAPRIAELARGEESCTQSFSHSLI